MACKYIYNGETFSRIGILKLIRDEQITAPLNRESARKWLRDKLGMTDEEISIIKGLIDGNAYGRFKKDGRILMSDTLEGVQYHEGFHRVYQTLIGEELREALREEFKQRDDKDTLLQAMRELYPELGENDLIEEALANEFMYFQLNDGRYHVPEQTRSVFQKILDLLKRLLGIEPVMTTLDLFRAIRNGQYRGVKPAHPAYRTADMVELGERTLGVKEKNELFSYLNTRVLEQITDGDLLYEFVDGKLAKDSFQETMTYALLEVLEPMLETDSDLAWDIIEDVFGLDVQSLSSNTPIRSDSKLIAAFQNYATQFSLKIQLLDGNGQLAEDVDSVENESQQVGDSVFSRVAFEYDPRGNLNRAIKLLLAGIRDVNKNTEILELPRTVPYNEVTKVLFNGLAGTPKRYEDVRARLVQLSEDFPWISPIIQKLNSDERMALDFMNSLVQNRYTFEKAYLRDGEHRYVTLNDDSQAGKYLQLWKNRIEYRNTPNLAQRLRETNDVATLTSLLGFDEINELELLEEAFDDKQTVAEKVSVVAGIVADALETLEENRSTVYSYRKENNVFSSVRDLAVVVANKGVPFDMLLLNSESKRIFSISQHTYQTIIQGHLNHIADEVRGMPLMERRQRAMERIQDELPHLLHVENYDGKTLRSSFLRDVANGERVQLIVLDGMDVNRSDNAHYSKSSLTDVLSQYVNAPLKGRVIGFKHGDRKVIYGYRRTFVDSFQYDDMLEQAARLASEYLFDEVRRINSPQPKGLAHVDKATQLQHFDEISLDDIKDLADGTAIYQAVGSKIKEIFQREATSLLEVMNEHRLFDKPEIRYEDNKRTEVTYPLGVDINAYKEFLAINEDQTHDAITLYATVNNFFGFIEQMRVFIGEPYNYKSFTDFYKRAQMQSSTGTPMSYGERIDTYIEELNRRANFGERTYGINDLKRSGYQSELVVYDQNFASSAAVDKTFTSTIDGREVSMVEYLVEQGVFAETQDEALAKADAQLSMQAMLSYDENDGQSWINMFFWREYMIRSGKWNDHMQNTFNIELSILRNPERPIKDTTVFISPLEKDVFYVEPGVGRKEVKIFDYADVESQLGDAQVLMKYTDYATVLKPQYTGPFVPNDPTTHQTGLNLIAGRKTAYMVMLPSTIQGTQLQEMNTMMLDKGIDSIHMVSAAKYGRRVKHPDMVLYKDGLWNTRIGELADEQVTYLPIQFQKDQVNVSTTPKTQIKNATQSAKTMLQNMFRGGVPIDFEGDNWNDLDENEKLEESPIYKIYKDYKDSFYAVVEGAATDLENALGIDNNKLGRLLRTAAREREEPQYMLDAIEKFLEHERIDVLPNAERVENILYSLVTKAAINIYRPGMGIPQVSTSLWETQARKTDKDGTLSTDEQVTSFYTLNEDGSLNPAKVIMPIPPKMIPMLLNMAGTTNIMEALDIYEQLPDEDKLVYKSLRIPNQQFSFNDVFRVERFTSPLTQSFVVVPSEIVPKTDADFDLDKQQLYGYAYGEDGNILRADTRNSREGLQARYNQWKELGSLKLGQISYNEEYSHRDVRDLLIEDIKILKDLSESLHKRFNINDPNSELSQELMGDLINLQVKYDVDGGTIWETIRDARSELQSLSGYNEPQGEVRVMQLRSAIAELFDLFEPNRTEQRELKEQRREVYDALEGFYTNLNQARLDRFAELYPTVEAQTHPLIRHNTLLDAEIQMLLSKENAHKMVSSADDSYISKQLFSDLVGRLEGVSPQTVLRNNEEYTLGKMNSASFLSVYGNALRFVQMVASKSNVGPVALTITHHNVGQVDAMQLAESYLKGKVVIDTQIPIEGYEDNYSMSAVRTQDGKAILDLLSMILTSQVDGVNNPYAPKMGLDDNNLGMTLMLLRRGVSLPVILDLINNPLVREYLQLEQINRSKVISSGGFGKAGLRKGNNALIEEVLSGVGMKPSKFKTMRERYNSPNGTVLKTQQLRDRVGKKPVNGDVSVLAVYLKLRDHARDYLGVVLDMGVDTTPKKNLGEVFEMYQRRTDVQESGIVETNYRNGFLRPFFNNQNLYTKLYDKYYKLPQAKLDNFVDEYYPHLRGEQLTQVRNVITEDLVVFALQNYVPTISKYNVEQLLSNGVVRELANTQNDNYAFNMLLPILNIGSHPQTGEPMDNIKIVDKGVTTVSINDMYESFKLLDPNLQEQLLAISIYQSGISRSPFSLRTIIPTELMDGILEEAVAKIEDLKNDDSFWSHFLSVFMRAHPQYLPYSRKQAFTSSEEGALPYYAQKGERYYKVFKTETNQELPITGSPSPAFLNLQRQGLPPGSMRPVADEGSVEDFTQTPVNNPDITCQG